MREGGDLGESVITLLDFNEKKSVLQLVGAVYLFV
jgi:hypothetical protein